MRKGSAKFYFNFQGLERLNTLMTPWSLRERGSPQVNCNYLKRKIHLTVKTVKCSMQKAQDFLHKTEIFNETIYDSCKIMWMRGLSTMDKLKRNKNLSTTQSFKKESVSFPRSHTFAPIVRLGLNIRIIWLNSIAKRNIQ